MRLIVLQELKVDIRRAIYSLSFLVSVINMMLVIFMGIGKQLFPNTIAAGLNPYYHSDMVFRALSSDIVLMAVPQICTLPYTAAFLDEFTSGYIKTYLMKCDKQRYINAKVIAAGISGGLAIVIGIMGAYFLSSLIYKPMEIYEPSAVAPYLDLIKKSLVFLCAGCLLSSVGALLANLSMSKYMAYAAPFVIYYMLVILSERYFTDLYVINPQEWLKMQEFWPGKEWGIMLLMFLLNVIVMLINSAVIERKLDS